MILVDIGNSRVRYATLDGEAILPVESMPTDQLRLPEIADDVTRYGIASVVPEASLFFPAERSIFVTWRNAGLTFAADIDPATIGADRLANAVALKRRFGKSALCIDAGSCITAEVLDAEGAFAGGAIFPGRSMSRFAVGQRAAQLYDTPLSETVPTDAGRTTTEAMMFGIDRGLLGAVREIIDVLCKAHNIPLSSVVLTGGDGDFFAAPLGVPYIPDLTFLGIAEVMKNSTLGE